MTQDDETQIKLEQLQRQIESLLVSNSETKDPRDVPVQYPWGKHDPRDESESENSSNSSESGDEWKDSTRRLFEDGKWEIHEGMAALLDGEDDSKHERKYKFIKRVNRKYKEPVGGWAKSARMDSIFEKYTNYNLSSTIGKDDRRSAKEERKQGVTFKFLATLDWRLEQFGRRLFRQEPSGISAGAIAESINSMQNDVKEFAKYTLSQKQHTRLERRTKLADRVKAPNEFTSHLKTAGADSREDLFGPSLIDKFLTSTRRKQEDNHGRNMAELARSFQQLSHNRNNQRQNTDGNNRGGFRGGRGRGDNRRGRGGNQPRGGQSNNQYQNNNTTQREDTA